MLKILWLLPLIVLFGCTEESTELYDNKNSLDIVFGKDGAVLKNELTDDEFYVYVTSLEYAFNNAEDRSVVEWTGPNEIFKGKISLLKTVSSETMLCKDFKQDIVYKETTYNGKATACALGTNWTVKKLKE